MRRLAWLFIGSMATTFVAILVAGLMADTVWPPDVAAVVRVPPHLAIRVVSAPDMPARWMQIALDRPLFRPDRRPPRLATPVAELRLAGIVITPLGRAAIFAPGTGGKLIVAGVGTKVGPWTVTRIEQEVVAVAGVNGDRLLQPAFDAQPAATALHTAKPLASSAYLPGITRLLQRRPE